MARARSTSDSPASGLFGQKLLERCAEWRPGPYARETRGVRAPMLRNQHQRAGRHKGRGIFHAAELETGEGGRQWAVGGNN